MSSEPTGPSKLTVLLVEDHVDSRTMYAEFLRVEYTVLEAGDGISALDLILTSAPDVVVTDLALPRMDGFELVARLRADERVSKIPVIALSGHSSEAYHTRARAVGIDLLLLKPCPPDELSRAVAKMANDRKELR